MRKFFLFAALFLISNFTLFAQAYITNVTIADVVGHKLIPGQTVVITEDLISNIQSNKKIKIPASATVIDGTSLFV